MFTGRFVRPRREACTVNVVKSYQTGLTTRPKPDARSFSKMETGNRERSQFPLSQAFGCNNIIHKCLRSDS